MNAVTSFLIPIYHYNYFEDDVNRHGIVENRVLFIGLACSGQYNGNLECVFRTTFEIVLSENVVIDKTFSITMFDIEIASSLLYYSVSCFTNRVAILVPRTELKGKTRC